ncbi:MAG: ATP synthase F1 subunit delta [Patescibacteria group bacterium]
MKRFSPQQYAHGLYEALRNAPEEKIPAALKSFVALVARNRDLSKSPKIIEAFRAYANEQENILEIDISSVEPLSQGTKQLIIRNLETSLKKTIVLNESTDTGLLGGIVMRYGDTVINGSVQKRLELLHSTLKK